MEEVPPVSLVESRSSDESLFERFRDKGDENALRTLIERHWPSVFRLAHAIVRDAQHAEDAAQEALVRIVQAARTGRRLDPFAGWLRSVTVNEARMSLRSRKRRERREEAAPARQAGDLDPAAKVREYTESLDELHRVPLVLHYGQGLTHREVGEALGCPTGTASSRIREGLEKVREALSGKGMPVALGAIEAALAAPPGVPVPPVPRIERIIARGAKAAGMAASKKLALALVAFILCAAGVGGMVATRLTEEPEATPRKLVTDSATPGRGTAPSSTEHAVAPDRETVSAPSSASTFSSSRRPGSPSEGGTETAATPPTSGTGPNPRPDSAGAAAALAHVRGRVLDPEGRPVPGAHVTLACSRLGGRGPSIKIRRKAPHIAPGAVPGNGPQVPGGFKSFAAFDGDIERTTQTSRTLRALADLAATESAADGTFDIGYPSTETGKLYVNATIDRQGDTYSGEKPVSTEDVGDVVVKRLPAVLVTVRCGGAPAQGATVQFLDAGGDLASALTDASGTARHVTAVPRVLVTVGLAGYAARTESVSLASDDAPLAIDLVPAAQILGTVRGPSGPVVGASVVAFDSEAPEPLVGEAAPIASATTDGDGRFTLDGLTAGREYEVTATPLDETILKGTLDVTAPANAADMTLGRGGRVDATLSAPSNDPHLQDWPGVGVQKLDGGNWRPLLEADADRVVQGNTISFKRLPPGTYRVFAHAFIFNEAASDPVTIGPDGGTLGVSLALEVGRTVHGKIVDATGAPVQKARVARGSGGAMMVLIAGPDGLFEIPGFPDGPGQLTISASGFAERTVPVDGQATDVGTVVLEPAPPQQPPGPQPETPPPGK